MPKASTKAEKAVKPGASLDTAEQGTPTEEAKPAKGKKTSFEVLNSGGSRVRTYSVEQHGKDAEDLAEQYAKKINGSVK